MQDVPCTYRISVKAVIRDDEKRIFLIRESDGRWELPGGGLEHGEDPRVALAREIMEEIGCTAEWVAERPETFWTINKDVGAGNMKWFAFVAYEARISGTFDPALHANDEAQEARYFSPVEARTLSLHDNTIPYFA